MYSKLHNHLLELYTIILEDEIKLIPIYIKNGVVVYSKTNSDVLKPI